MSDKIIVGVAGSGAMGSGIAQVAARAGHQVIVFDSDPRALDRAKVATGKDFEKLIGKGKITREESEQIISAITYTNAPETLRPCGLVIEAIIENLEIKKELFQSIEKFVDANCILATNTSSLSIVAVAAACRERSRVIGIHFFNPAVIMPLVEIIPAFTTSQKIIDASRQIIDSWGKITVLAKDTPGFIVNRIARPYYGESIKMFEEGFASFETIDWALKEYGGFKMGPFELMDFIGNDINYKVTETVWEQLFYDARYRPSLTQKRLYEAGLFGRKSGRGYYSYEENVQVVAPDKNEEKGKYIFERVIAMLINEAADALFLKIATRDDIDTAMTKGVNYPEGLLKWADRIGIGRILNVLLQLQNDFNEDRYRPSVLLKKMVTEGKTFY